MTEPTPSLPGSEAPIEVEPALPATLDIPVTSAPATEGDSEQSEQQDAAPVASTAPPIGEGGVDPLG